VKIQITVQSNPSRIRGFYARSRQVLLTGLLTSLRFCSALWRVDERYGDVSPIDIGHYFKVSTTGVASVWMGVSIARQ